MIVDIAKLRKGDKVHYQPEHFKEDDEFENGMVKSIAPNGGVFVVYNCAGQWADFENYTAANTDPIDLYMGWRS
jgi:hypothetical protein